MQKVNREILAEKAKRLLTNGVCDRVLGWKRGEFDYDVATALFTDADSIDRDFVYDDFCGANFSKYLIAQTIKTASKVLVFLKPCDSYSYNQLLTEHRFDPKKVHAIGIPCEGMFDANKIRTLCGDFTAVKSEGGKVIVSTLFDGDVEIDRSDALAERCINCKSRKCVAYDELLTENGEFIQEKFDFQQYVKEGFEGKYGEVRANDRFAEVERLEKMTPDERFAFWQNELSRCIRCNACRDVCPACTCEKCVFDNPKSGVENKAPSTSFEESMFHIIRAFHVAGRCTDCGECSRVCPQHIPLHLLNRKFIKDIDEFYGDYQAGESAGSRAPLAAYTTGDIEPGKAVESERRER